MFINEIIQGDAVDILRYPPSESIDCCITSPPYWQLRDYKTYKQLGKEPTYDYYLIRLIDIFREVHRMLKPTGSCWVVMGDTYNGTKKGNTNNNQKEGVNDMPITKHCQQLLPDKTMCMIPERFALSMVEHLGFCLRNKIIWYKPNAMPNSAPDRFGVDYENVYFFTKNSRGYYYEQQYESFKSKGWGKNIKFGGNRASSYGNPKYSGKVWKPKEMKVTRSVWKINTKPFTGAHFAVFPEQLVERMMRAGCPENGTVLDCFMGAGTVAVVAKRLKRNYLGVELNEDYIKLAQTRLQNIHKNTLSSRGYVSTNNDPHPDDLLLDAYI